MTKQKVNKTTAVSQPDKEPVKPTWNEVAATIIDFIKTGLTMVLLAVIVVSESVLSLLKNKGDKNEPGI